MRPLTRIVLASLACGCSGEDLPTPVAVPWDDDVPRLGHCAFVPAPSREPRPSQPRAPLRAGIGRAVLEMPIGTPLGAYGARVKALGGAVEPDTRAARWATGMTVSVGVHDAPAAEAVALEAGGERLLLMRVDAPLVTENALFELERALAPDGSMRGRILLTASHSHAAWGAWLPTVYLAPGVDAPRRELLDRAVDAMRRAGEAALAALAPARLGFAVDASFDPDDTLTQDRRPDNDAVLGPDGNTAGSGKDPIAWAMRIDDATGAPVAALVNVAIHGTVGEGANPLASSDAPGAIARAMSSELGYPVLHLQGATGDVSPASVDGREACPDEVRCLDIPALEILGARAAAMVGPLVTGVQTDSDAALEIVTRTFGVGRGGVVERPDGRQLYYLPPDREYTPDRLLFDETAKALSPFDEFNTIGGAGLCGVEGQPTFAPLPGIAGLMPYASCIDLDRGAGIILGLFAFEPQTLPLCDSVRSTGAAIRIGTPSGDWLLVGVPGEPTAPYAAYLRARSPAGPERTLIIGYADEYSGYMLTGEDWLSGGYECSTNLWGPREGEQILEALLDAAAVAWTPELEDPEPGGDRFESFAFPSLDPVPAVDTNDHGTALTGSPALWWPDVTTAALTAADATVARAVGVARFAWRGGDPAADFPEVVVEREIAMGQFEPLLDAAGVVASSHRGVVLVTYLPEPIDSAAPTVHSYAASWQSAAPDPLSIDEPLRPYALTLGRYRLRATGRAMASGGIEAYEVSSPVFEVVAAPLAVSSQALGTAAGIALVGRIGPAPGLRALRDGVSDGELPLPGPWQATVTFDDTTTQVLTAAPDTNGNGNLALPAADVARAVTVELRDPVGNGGTLPVQ